MKSQCPREIDCLSLTSTPITRIRLITITNFLRAGRELRKLGLREIGQRMAFSKVQDGIGSPRKFSRAEHGEESLGRHPGDLGGKSTHGFSRIKSPLVQSRGPIFSCGRIPSVFKRLAESAAIPTRFGKSRKNLRLPILVSLLNSWRILKVRL